MTNTYTIEANVTYREVYRVEADSEQNARRQVLDGMDADVSEFDYIDEIRSVELLDDEN